MSFEVRKGAILTLKSDNSMIFIVARFRRIARKTFWVKYTVFHAKFYCTNCTAAAAADVLVHYFFRNLFLHKDVKLRLQFTRILIALWSFFNCSH